MNHRIEIRNAEMSDLPTIISLLADIVVSPDPVRYADEVMSDPPLESYLSAFREILSPPNQALVAVIDQKVVGYVQISYLPGLTRRGQKRAIVEDVRIDRNWRGRKVGKMLMERAINEAKEKGCWVIQLTTNKWRNDAISFYESLGFSRSHEGMRIQF